ncbi:MAG: 6-carboxytetrahydropterin synthase QueD, partial [Candidatus Anstonellales archaeon]
MKYEIYVESQFSSAHYLRMYKGKCENLHGHNWKVGVYIGAQKLNSIGMVLDFKDLKKILKKVLDKLDHKLLNKEVNFFKTNQPTAENIARYIYENI